MKVALTTEVRVYKVGKKYYTTGPFYKILERYSKAFGRVDLITRVLESRNVPEGGISIDRLCDKIVGFSSLFKALIPFSRSDIEGIIENDDLIIMRFPSLISMRLYKYVMAHKKKYMVEVMGCVLDAYWNHGLIGKILAPYCFMRMRHIVKKADYALYVTREFLQRRYPCHGRQLSASNVEIRKTHDIRNYSNIQEHKRIRLLTAAGVNVRYKGQQYVIKALKILKSRGMIADYYLAGGGDQERLRRIARRNHVDGQVHFLGELSRDELFEKMNEVNFYIQPSLQEGLPRSVIEAMSCGLVCLGANTGGIPELLAKKQIFRRRSSKSIVDAILRAINDENLCAISAENIEKSKVYLADAIDARRTDFFSSIKSGIFAIDKGDSRKKIALIINRLVGGGAERVVCNLANYLYEKGFDVDIVAMSAESKESYFVQDGVRKIYLLDDVKKIGKINKLVMKWRGIKNYVMNNGNISCYIAMIPLNAFMITRLRKKIDGKIIVSERNNPGSHTLREKLMMKYASKRCDGFVVQTGDIGRWYKNVANKIIIPNAVNNEDLPERSVIRKKVVTVGRLEKQKNYPMMIKVFAAFHETHPDYTLEIYGDGSQKAEIYEMIRRFGLENCVLMHGYVKDAFEQIADVACFIMTSDHEGVSNALIEAMSIGIPCVVTDCDGGGARSLIDGKNGVLVEKNDVDGMVAALCSIIDNKKKSASISSNAKKIAQRLSGKKVYGKWLSYINSIIEPHSGHESKNGI